MRERPNLRIRARGLPVAEHLLETRTGEELRGSLANLDWAAYKSSTSVSGSAIMVLRAARLAA